MAKKRETTAVLPEQLDLDLTCNPLGVDPRSALALALVLAFRRALVRAEDRAGNPHLPPRKPN